MDSAGKSPLLSKTLWVNILAVVAMLVQGQTGFIIDAEAQIAILGVINLVLRAITREPLNWPSSKSQSGYSSLSLLHCLVGLCLLLTLVVGLAGCSTQTVKTSAKSLILTQQTVVAAAEAADSMCTAGTLNQEQCDEVAGLYAKAKDAYDVALVAEQAVIDAAIAGDDQTEDAARAAYSAALSGFTGVATQLVAVATKYGLLEDK